MRFFPTSGTAVKCVLLLLAAACSVSGLEFEKFWYANRKKLWRMTEKELTEKTGLNLKSDATALRYKANPKKKDLKIFGVDAAAIQFSCLDGKLSSIYISVYERNGGKKLDGAKFRRMRLAMLNNIPGMIGRYQAGKSRTSIAGKPCNVRTWSTANGVWTVTWCEDRGVSEFLTVQLDSPPDASAAVPKAVDAASRLPQTDEEGYTFIQLPEQLRSGGKGYCSAAGIARIMRFYGIEPDQHMLAQIARADMSQKTLVKNVYLALEKLRNRMNVRMEKIIGLEYLEDNESIHRFILKYNNTAAKMDMNPLYEESFIVRKKRKKHIDVADVMEEALKQPEVYRKLRLRETGDKEKFRSSITAYINKGMPLVWLVHGHMNIITGYNSQSGEIIYTGSTGTEKERRVMSIDDAWVQTAYLLVLSPKRR